MNLNVHRTSSQPAFMRLSKLSVASFAFALSACGMFGDKKVELPLPTPTGPNPAKILWTQSIGNGGIGFAPVLVNGSVFAASADGTVARINADTGQVIWKQNIGKSISAGIGSDGETSVVVTREGEVQAFTGAGATKWTVQLKIDSQTPPAVGVGVVVVRAAENRVLALDLDTGRQRWSFQRPTPPLVLRQASAIAMNSSTAFVGLAGGRLVALGLNDGVVRWEAAVGLPKGGNDIERLSDVVGTPLIIGREICAVAVRGNIACFDSANGQPLWNKPHQSNTGLDVDDRIAVSATDDSKIVAFERSGTPAWTQDGFKGRDLSAPAIAGRAVLFGDRNGLIHSVAKASGAPLGNQSTDGSAIVSQPSISDKQVVFQTSAGSIVSLKVE